MSKLLFITYKRWGGVMEGGGQGAKKNYDALCSLVGAENVTPYYVHDDDKKRSLKSYIEGVLYMPFGYYFGITPHRVQSIVRMAQEYAYVFIDRSLFGIIAKKLKEQNYAGKIITYYHNIEAVYMDAKISKHLPFRNILIGCADINDRWGCQYSDKVVALNERDNAELVKRYGRGADVLIPVALKDQIEWQPDTTIQTGKRPKCLSIGAYFGPNNEGILWFVENVLPKVEVEYKIVGKGMGQLKKDEPELLKDIEVVPDAPSLAPYLEEADVMILPIFAGSGMKVKTCECLMYGKNIFGTNETFEGYEVDYKKVGGLCNTAEEFVEALQDMASNPRPRWNSYSRKVFEEKYSLQAQIIRFKQLIQETE